MNALADLARRDRGEWPAAGWWLLLGAAMALHLALPLGWAAAVGLLVFVLVQRARPLDFITSYYMVVAGAAFINYGRGFLTFELSLLTVGILFMLFCYGLERRGRWLTIPHTPLTAPLLIYLGLSLVNYGRGVLVGNSMRYAGLELIAVFGLASSFMIGSRGIDRTMGRAALIWIYAISLGHTAMGLWAYAVMRVRVGGLYFLPVPGVTFVMLLAFAIRAKTTTRAVLGLLALTPLLLHQFLSFTRGFWFAIMGSTLLVIFAYTGRGPGVGARWRRTLVGLAVMLVLSAGAATMFASALGIGDFGEVVGSRFASSTSTEMSIETGSNIVRLVEYFHVLDLVLKNPIFGYGLGYWFVVREPIGFRLVEQWFVHENYLLVTLKQGLIGLAVFIWMLLAAFRTSVRGWKLPEDWQSAWCHGSAAVTFYIIIYSLVHFPLAEVNTVFLTALVWGATMGMTRTGETVVRWRKPAVEEGGGA